MPGDVGCRARWGYPAPRFGALRSTLFCDAHRDSERLRPPRRQRGLPACEGRRARLEGDRGQGDRACASPTGSRNRRAATANAESEVGPRCGALSSRSPPRGTGTSPGQTSQQSATSLSGLGLGLDSRLPGGLPKPCVKPLPRAVRTARPGRRGRTPRWLSKARASPERKTLGRAERPSLAGLGARGVHG